MSRLAQCPSCHSEYELDDDDIGHTFPCECGAELFACDAAKFECIAIHCAGCGESYEVTPDEIGETMQCECGQLITIPDVVFQVAIATSGQLPDRPEPGVSCPKCNAQYNVSGDDVGETAQCDCGCVFQIVSGQEGRFLARPVKEPNASVIVVPQEDAAAKDRRSSHAVRPSADEADEKKSVPWFGILGFGSVALLLIVSVVMFLLREKPSRKTADTVASSAPSTAKMVAIPPADIETDRASQSVPEPSMSAGVQEPATVKSIQATVEAGQSASEGGSESASATPVPPSARRKPQRQLPQLQPARAFVPIIPPPATGYTFERAFRECFEAYDQTTQRKNDAKLSGSADDVAAYHQQLGKTLGLMHQAHEIGMRDGETEQIHELRYLLAYLHYDAGHLAEAAIFGEAVARWGDPAGPAAREAAMIALSAMQEANAVGWGQRENVAELRQMEAIAEIIAERWPDDPQLGTIWMSLAQLYDIFGFPIESSDAYAKVAPSSEHYATAQITAGQTLWSEYLRDPEASDSQLLQSARQRMTQGTEALSSDTAAATQSLLSAKLTLARIAMRADDPQDAVRWLTEPPNALVDSITVSGDAVDERHIQVTQQFFRLAYETLFDAKSQLNDPQGARDALETMSGVLGVDTSVKLNRLMLESVTDSMNQLAVAESVTAQQIESLAEMTEPLVTADSELDSSNVLWIAESWSKIAQRAATPDLAAACFQRSAVTYDCATQRDDFPVDSRQSAWLRQAELWRSAGKPSEAIAVIEKVLRDSPRAFALQIEAAKALQEKALAEGKPLELISAINGPQSQSSEQGDSAIWGWGRLVATLHNVRFSDNATEKSKQQFYESQYNLLQCQWLIAKATPDAAIKQERSDDVAGQLKKTLATYSIDNQPWYSLLQQLEAEVTAR